MSSQVSEPPDRSRSLHLVNEFAGAVGLVEPSFNKDFEHSSKSAPVQPYT